MFTEKKLLHLLPVVYMNLPLQVLYLYEYSFYYLTK